jgi:hypothetical protein
VATKPGRNSLPLVMRGERIQIYEKLYNAYGTERICPKYEQNVNDLCLWGLLLSCVEKNKLTSKSILFTLKNNLIGMGIMDDENI